MKNFATVCAVAIALLATSTSATTPRHHRFHRRANLALRANVTDDAAVTTSLVSAAASSSTIPTSAPFLNSTIPTVVPTGNTEGGSGGKVFGGGPRRGGNGKGASKGFGSGSGFPGSGSSGSSGSEQDVSSDSGSGSGIDIGTGSGSNSSPDLGPESGAAAPQNGETTQSSPSRSPVAGTDTNQATGGGRDGFGDRGGKPGRGGSPGRGGKGGKGGNGKGGQGDKKPGVPNPPFTNSTGPAGPPSTNGTKPENATSIDLLLLEENVQTGSQQDGLNEGSADAGQSPSATDAANFINVCTGKTKTNGLQVKGGSCNGICMGDIPSTENMISSLITFPLPGRASRVKANTSFDIKLQVRGLVPGSFTNPSTTYYAAPQALQDGKIVGHTHVTVQSLGDDVDATSPPEPDVFIFFKGINDEGDGNGGLTASVIGGIPKGAYRACTMTAASNHQPVLMPVAQRGAQDDCSRFIVE